MALERDRTGKETKVGRGDAQGKSPVTYEAQLDGDPTWAVMEGSRHFEEQSAVFAALHRIVRRLDELEIPYAVAGGMALFQSGYRRFTEDVNILVTPEGMAQIFERLDGLGYTRPQGTEKCLRDSESGVKIEFLTTGGFPGDGKPKPISFPNPADVGLEGAGIRYLNLPSLVELKLASGMSGAGRLKDLADVQELIKLLKLDADFSEQLNSYVRPRFLELWEQSR
ncbi:MAG: nucleotidyltransferase family protein [Candidatus Sumerlaeaceae bacterium]|nr:nucleotidyltransferase family protein [Candidatus Sumerlaeaceae bacterium]